MNHVEFVVQIVRHGSDKRVRRSRRIRASRAAGVAVREFGRCALRLGFVAVGLRHGARIVVLVQFAAYDLAVADADLLDRDIDDVLFL